MAEGKTKTTLVLTYNDVEGYPAGIHERNGHKVIVHSSDGRYYQGSAQKLQELMHGLYGKVNLEKVDEVIVYAGLNAMQGALAAASTMANNNGKKVKLVACACDNSRKTSFANRTGIEPIIWSECGGANTLGRLVGKILRGE